MLLITGTSSYPACVKLPISWDKQIVGRRNWRKYNNIFPWKQLRVLLEVLENELCAMNQRLLRVMANVKLDFSSFKRFLARIHRLENKYLSLQQWLENKMATCHRPRDIHCGPTRRNDELKFHQNRKLVFATMQLFCARESGFQRLSNPFRRLTWVGGSEGWFK